MKALLLSGGMDSSALAYWLRPEVFISVDYGQLAANAEIEIARRISVDLAIPLEVISSNVSHLGRGIMAGAKSLQSDPCPEWWPYRNQFLVTISAMRSLAMGVTEIIFGAVTTDGEAHADGRPRFFEQISQLLAFQEGNITVTAPAIQMTTLELVRQSGIPIEQLVGTHSCHTGSLACGQCRGCWKRETVLYDLGLIKV